MSKALLVAMLAAALLLAAELLLPWAPLRRLLEEDPVLARLLLVELRLPRALLAAGYGAVLGLSGAALQAIFANPLASPDITGSSSGAALGTVAGSYWLGLTAPLAMALAGAAGAGLALALLLLLAGHRAETATLLLAGLAISALAAAATGLALALAPSPFAFYDSYDWLMGSLVDRNLEQAAVALGAGAIAALLLVPRRDALDSLALGEDVAASLGMRPRQLRLRVVTASAIGVGGCVAVCGAVGFVGLVAPVVARRLVAGHPGRALVPAAIVGALLLLAADLVTRSAPLGRPLPVGIVTALCGTPLFLWIVLTMRWRLTP